LTKEETKKSTNLFAESSQDAMRQLQSFAESYTPVMAVLTNEADYE
jgi:hypothetical protein